MIPEDDFDRFYERRRLELLLELEQLETERLRRELARNGARPAVDVAPATKKSGRPLSMTPDAVRARTKRAELAAARARQGELQFAPPATVVEAVATAVATGRDRSASLSDLPDQDLPKKEQRPTVAADGRRGRVRLDPTAIPATCAAIAREVRPDLDAELVARSWAKFARAKADEFATESRMEAAWQGWIERERVPKPDTPAPPASEKRAIHRESTEVLEAQRRHEQEAAPPEVAGELARNALRELGVTQRHGTSHDVALRHADEPPAFEAPCPLALERERARVGLAALDVDEDLEAVLGPTLARGGALRPPEPRAMSA